MRTVIQRVCEASVSIDGTITAEIGTGMLLLLGIEESDTMEDIEWLCGKITRLRIFPDEVGVMNLSLNEVNGDILLVSQFTLFASTKKGNRPSYTRAANPDTTIPLYEKFIRTLENVSGKTIQTGIFGAMMQIHLVNDGPVTILLDTKNKE